MKLLLNIIAYSQFLYSISSFALDPFSQEGKWNIKCGTQTTNLSYRVTPAHTLSIQKPKFAILLGGSPATTYFSDAKSEMNDLSHSLLELGYSVIEVKYPTSTKSCGSVVSVDGFYSACCGQGIQAVAEHSARIYDFALQALGISQNTESFELVGIGYSLGAVQLEFMAFQQGKYFDKVALTGILAGDSVQGCKTGHNLIPNFDGMAWTGFMNYFDAITTSTRGCSQKWGAALEYTSDLNFENLPYFQATELGLFEGDLPVLGGHPDQAKYISDHRKSAPTQLSLFSNCGHDPWACENGKKNLNSTLLNWLKGNY